MGGDRRSPPRRRGRGDGGGKLKGSKDGSVIGGGRGNTTGVRINSSGSIDKIQHGRSATKEISSSSNSLNLSNPVKIQGPNLEILGHSDQGAVESNSICITNTGDNLGLDEDLNGEQDELEELPLTDKNLQIQSNEKSGIFHMAEMIVEDEDAHDEEGDLGMYMNGRDDGNHSNLQSTKELPTGMILNVLNPMFMKDNGSAHLDGDCEMMLNVEEDFGKNQNAGGLSNLAAGKFMSNWSCTESVQEKASEVIQNGNEKNIENGNSGFYYPRNEINKETVMSQMNNRTTTPNAWKKPVHVPVDWQNKGKASIDGKFVNLNLEAVNTNQMKLEKALVGKLIGRRLPFHILSSELQKRWQSYGEFKCLLTGEESFICIFSSSEARDAVLMGGPWLIGGYVVGLDKWSPDYSHDSICGLTAPVWIRFPKLPLLYWDNDNLARIASMVGQPLWIDALTSEIGRCAFARVCVRLDFAQKLPTGVWIHGIKGNFFQRVEYEGINQVCFKCGHIGHKVENCALTRRTNAGEQFPANKDNNTFGWKKVNQERVHNANGGAVGNSAGIQFSTELNSNGHIEVGECSNAGAHPCLGNVTNDTADADDDTDYGPWIYVSRKKNKFKKGANKVTDSKQGSFKKAVVDKGQDQLHKSAGKGKSIQNSDYDSLPSSKVISGNVHGIFTASRNSDGKSLTAGKGKGPKGAASLELNQVSFFIAGSKKRRKEQVDVDFEDLLNGQVDGIHEDLGANKIDKEMSTSTRCGGDASPLVD